MLSYILTGVVIWLVYRFWDSSQKKVQEPEREMQEPDEYTDYEEID